MFMDLCDPVNLEYGVD